MLRSEQIVNECLRIIHGNLDTDQALQEALAYLGSALEADRVYTIRTNSRLERIPYKSIY